MTTIAVRDGVLAADSCTNCIGATFQSNPKLWKSERTGSMFGFSGVESAAILFKEWYENEKDRKDFPDYDDTFTFLEVKKDETYWLWFDDMVPIKIDVKYMAIGSGAHYALGAMSAGAIARTAVSIACKYDPFSTIPVRSFEGPLYKIY